MKTKNKKSATSSRETAISNDGTAPTKGRAAFSLRPAIISLHHSSPPKCPPVISDYHSSRADRVAVISDCHSSPTDRPAVILDYHASNFRALARLKINKGDQKWLLHQKESRNS